MKILIPLLGVLLLAREASAAKVAIANCSNRTWTFCAYDSTDDTQSVFSVSHAQLAPGEYSKPTCNTSSSCNIVVLDGAKACGQTTGALHKLGNESYQFTTDETFEQRGDSSHTFDNVSNVCARDLGAKCSADSQCLSYRCVDGVCCDSSCDGSCDACNLSGHLGTCTNQPAGAHTASCQAPNVCAGQSTCALVEGHACSLNRQCQSNVCRNGVCTGSNPRGEFCSQDLDCSDGVCSSGLCCDRQCHEGNCESCHGALTPGVCRPTPVHQQSPLCQGPDVCDGQGHCMRSGGEKCHANEECQSGRCILVTGVNDCTKANCVCIGTKTKGEQCSSPFDCGTTGGCADGVCCEQRCGPCGTCAQPGSVGQCVPLPAGNHGQCTGDLVCSGTGPLCVSPPGDPCSRDNQCASGNCVQNRCTGMTLNGSTCSTATECRSGQCADGVCCDQACSGECQSCALQGAAGQCLPVPVGGQDLMCVQPKACNGAGHCGLPAGSVCTADADCAGLPGDRVCVRGAGQTGGPGVCGDKACNSCFGPDRNGVCQVLPNGANDLTCPAPNHCTGRGQCGSTAGGPCADDQDCSGLPNAKVCNPRMMGAPGMSWGICAAVKCGPCAYASNTGQCVPLNDGPQLTCSGANVCKAGQCVPK